MAKVFISHGGDHGPTAEIRRWFVADGHEVFLDTDLRDGIRAGDEWELRLHEKLRWADAVVCVVTPEFVASTWCAAEVGAARTRGCKVLPVLTQHGVKDPLLSSIQHIDMESDPAAARQALSVALRRVDASGGVGWPDSRSPFPGLRPFDIELRSVFFGRSAEVDHLLEVLRSPVDRAEGTVVLMVGPSGCGKSSLVRAGLVPRVAEEPGWWTAPPFVPGADPVRALARALAVTATQLGLERSVDQVLGQLGDGGMVGVADDILLAAPGGPARRLLVVVDQFEELVTQAGGAERTQFANLLHGSLSGPVQLLATVRPEFLDQLLAEPELAALPARPHLVRPLRRETLRIVIEGPARLAGITVSDDLVARLVADTDSGEALPLLAFTLAQLAHGVGRGDELSASRYEHLGGVQGALTRQADDALSDAMRATGRDKDEVINGLLRLVTVDEHGRPTRWRVGSDSLPEPVPSELAAFVARRLVTTDADEAGRPMFGVAHEAFLTAWAPLVEAIAANVAALRARRAVENGAREWDSAGRPADRLWERGQLAAARADTGAVVTQYAEPPNDHSAATSTGLAAPSPGGRRRALKTDRIPISATAEAFLLASIRRDRLRRGRAAIILSILLVAALGAAGLLVVQLRATQEQQRLATARQLLSRAEGIRDSEPQTALMLGIAADQIHHDEQTTGALVESLVSTRYNGTLTGHTSDVGSPDFSADGRTMATAGFDARVILWDISDGRPRQLGPALTSDVELVGVQAFSPDGRLLATSRTDQTIVLWDISDLSAPRPVGSPIPASGEHLARLVFSPDSRTLAVGSSFPATAVLWDVSNPGDFQRLGEPTKLGSSLELLQFHPAGNALITGANSEDFRHSIVVWDITDRITPRQVGEPIAYDGNSAFDPRTQLLATDSPDWSSPEVTLWDLNDPRAPHKLQQPLAAAPDSLGVGVLQFSRDGSMLAIASQTNTNGGTVRIWDVKDPDRARPIEQSADLAGGATSSASYLPGYDAPPYPVLSTTISAVHFLPDRNAIATVGGEDNVVTLWDLADPAAPRQIGEPINATSGQAKSVSFLPAGRTLITGRADGTMWLSDLTDPDAPQRLGEPLTGTSPVESMAFEDNTILAIGRADGSVDGFDLSNPINPVSVDFSVPPLEKSEGLVLSQRAGLLAVREPDGSVRIADLRDSSRYGRITPPFFDGERGNGVARPLSFSPDGKTLAIGVSGWGSNVTLWDVTDPTHPRSLGPPLEALDFFALATFSPDGHLLANVVGAGAPPGVALIDIRDPASPTQLGDALTGHTDSVRAVAFSPDGQLLATGSTDRSVILWDTTDPEHARRIGLSLTGFASSLTALAFTPDGSTLVTGTEDGTVELWDLTDVSQPRQLAPPLAGLVRIVTALRFSADGSVLATGDADGTVIRWNLAGLTGLRTNAQQEACARTGRGLTPDEWSLYVPDLDYETTCNG